jgi:hypothetical protein
MKQERVYRTRIQGHGDLSEGSLLRAWVWVGCSWNILVGIAGGPHDNNQNVIKITVWKLAEGAA